MLERVYVHMLRHAGDGIADLHGRALALHRQA